MLRFILGVAVVASIASAVAAGVMLAATPFLCLLILAFAAVGDDAWARGR